jgi:DNA-binding CsgD family transcriptional regulator
LLSQAEGFRVMLGFLRGDGLDREGLQRALRLETGASPARIEFRPSLQAVLLQAWTGQLDGAATAIGEIRTACLERGEENDLVYVDFHAALFELWRGNPGAAAAIADDASARALLIDRDVPLAVAGSLRALLAASRGRIEEARAEAEEALVICRRCGWPTVAMWPMAALGHVEVSAGSDQAAVQVLEPLLSGGSAVFAAAEIISAPFVPDAVEALVQVGRLDEAQALIESLEQHGLRLDRPWARAIGGRGRAMLLAAQGDVDDACSAAEEAMAQHDRLPMPFERARTLLLLGQLQRRRRRKESALAALGEALQIFERLDSVLWADRARAELARVGAGVSAGSELTPTEQLVASLAADGMTNREVAAELFISPKTVEANLARVYRKLDIRSRAELGRRMGRRGS